MVSTSAVVKLGPVQFSCPCTVPHEGRAEPPVPARSRRCSCVCVATSAAVIPCFNSFWILGLFPPSHQSLYMARLEFWCIVGGSVKWCGCRGNRGSFPQNQKQRRDLAVPFRAHAREEVKQGCEQTSARHPCRPRKGESAGAVGPEPGRSWPACRSVRRDVVPSETRPSREDARRPRPPTPGPKSGQSSQTRAQGQLWGGGVASGGWRGRVRKGP